MGDIPAFHTEAAKELAERKRDAMENRERASLFLEELDALLNAAATPSPSAAE